LRGPLKLYLLRHGESEGNARRVFAARAYDPPLTELGVVQATLQAQALSSVGLGAIYSSPLHRTRQTAAIVRDRCAVPLTFSDALAEVNLGDLDGQRIDEDGLAALRAVLGEWEAGHVNTGFPGGETLAEVRSRFQGFLDQVIGGKEGPVLVVGHGVLFMAVLWAFCDNRRPRLLDNYMGRGHLSILVGADGRFDLVVFNQPPVRAPDDGRATVNRG
jgi:probable phosphoglycerate mutase